MNQAVAISVKQKRQSGMATDYFNLCQVCKEIKDYKLAEQYTKKSLRMANNMGNKNGQSISHTIGSGNSVATDG